MAPTNGFRGIAFLERGRAAAIHAGLSCVVVGLLAASMWWLWYRPPFFQIDGGWHVLRIVVLVDVVLGPMLTFIVFNRAKPELRRDLLCIVLLQLCALTYGAGTLYLHRPVIVAEAEGNLYCVNWPDLAKAGSDAAPAEKLVSGQALPAYVHVNLPQKAAERAALDKATAAGGALPIHRTQFYEAMTAARWDDLLKRDSGLDAMARNDAGIAAELARVRQSHATVPATRMGFVPLSCRYGLVMLVFDRQSRRMIDWMN